MSAHRPNGTVWARSLSRRELLRVLGMAALGAVVGCSAYEDTYRNETSGTSTAPARVDRNVIYGKAGDVPLTLDLYHPLWKPSPAPVVLFIHGGGFTRGDKTELEGTPEFAELLTRGYVLAAPNYRLAPRHPFPAAVEDVKCAVRHLRANAPQYAIDPARIGAFGPSAGGTLACLLGLTDLSAGLEGNGGNTEASSGVQAVVDFYGPTDFSRLPASEMTEKYLPGSTAARKASFARASPVTHVAGIPPPLLILHGDRDNVVPLSQSRALYERLQAVAAPADLVVVKNAGHGFEPASGPTSPTRREITRTVGEFFDRHFLTPAA